MNKILAILFLICASVAVANDAWFRMAFEVAGRETGGAWTPAELDGRVLWFDGSDTNYMTISGTNVTAWTDKINGVEATSTGAKPTIIDVDGKNVVYFNTSPLYHPIETNDYLVANARSVIVACTAKSSAGTYPNDVNFAYSDWINYSGIDNSTKGHSYLVSSSLFQYFHTAGGISAKSGGVTNGSAFIASSIKQSGTSSGLVSLYNNGTLLSLSTDSALNGVNPNQSGFTAIGKLGGALAKGYVHDLIYTPYELSESDRQKLEGYLAHKWGLTENLPSDHPYKSTAP